MLAVPRGQTDAARSLGLTETQVFFTIVFPQALRYIVPALVAQLVIVVKDTTFGYVVTYGELMQNAKVLIANYLAGAGVPGRGGAVLPGELRDIAGEPVVGEPVH